MRVNDGVFDNIDSQRVADLADWQVRSVTYRVDVRLQRFIGGCKDGIVAARGKQLGCSGRPHFLVIGCNDVGTKLHSLKQCLVIRVVGIGAQNVKHSLTPKGVHVTFIHVVGASTKQCAKSNGNNND